MYLARGHVVYLLSWWSFWTTICCFPIGKLACVCIWCHASLGACWLVLLWVLIFLLPNDSSCGVVDLFSCCVCAFAVNLWIVLVSSCWREGPRGVCSLGSLWNSAVYHWVLILLFSLCVFLDLFICSSNSVLAFALSLYVSVDHGGYGEFNSLFVDRVIADPLFCCWL